MRVVLLFSVFIFLPVTGYTQNLMPDKPAFLQKPAPKSVLRHKVITKPVVEQPEKPVLKSTSGTQNIQPPAPAEHVPSERERVLEKYKALAYGTAQ